MLDDPTFPLQRIPKEYLLDADITGEEARRKVLRQARDQSLIQNPEQISSQYPDFFEENGRILRYRFIPAIKQTKGLVTLFHGFKTLLHHGPMEAWDNFDLLAPWDNFGFQRKGSWFLGEKGQPFVEHLVMGLIRKFRAERPSQPWFCTGGSMGGFASLHLGIKYDCDGIYATEPQVDLNRKIEDYGADDPLNHYRYLRGEGPESLPNLYQIAEEKETLPPLYLVQQLYDRTNYLAEHAFRLLEIYNRKKAWYGARISPGIGHRSDPSQAEAQYFFNLIVEKQPERKVHFPLRDAEN
jgi:hypothetical protein